MKVFKSEINYPLSSLELTKIIKDSLYIKTGKLQNYEIITTPLEMNLLLLIRSKKWAQSIPSFYFLLVFGQSKKGTIIYSYITHVKEQKEKDVIIFYNLIKKEIEDVISSGNQKVEAPKIKVVKNNNLMQEKITPKKRGRKPKAVKSVISSEIKTPKKQGRKPGSTKTVAEKVTYASTKKRGRPAKK